MIAFNDTLKSHVEMSVHVATTCPERERERLQGSKQGRVVNCLLSRTVDLFGPLQGASISVGAPARKFQG